MRGLDLGIRVCFERFGGSGLVVGSLWIENVFYGENVLICV